MDEVFGIWSDNFVTIITVKKTGLKRALRAEIDPEAWAALYSNTSYPFDPPATGKIAIKAINHYGDEVLKVIAVSGDD